jgi:hypothetical protein
MEAIWAPVHASSFIGIDDSNVPEKNQISPNVVGSDN